MDEPENLLGRISEIRRDVSEAHGLAKRIAEALRVLTYRDASNYQQPHLYRDAHLLVTVADGLLTGMETWRADIQDGWKWQRGATSGEATP